MRQHFYPRPRVEGDVRACCHFLQILYFYPRPRVEGDGEDADPVQDETAFLSTPSRRGRRVKLDHGIHVKQISIHALRMEGDTRRHPSRRGRKKFLSTPSAWRATKEGIAHGQRENISIHALRMEGDTNLSYSVTKVIQFLSTPSTRRATCSPPSGAAGVGFLPTPSHGGRRMTA